MSKRRVVLTGAAGYIGQRMFRELSERWELVPIDARGTTRDGKAIPGIVVADLTQPNRDAYRRHFRGADAVIHCAYVSAPGLSADTWRSPTTSIGRPSRRASAGWSPPAPTTPGTTTSGSSGRAGWRWSRRRCRRGPTTGTAGPRPPTSSWGSSSPPARSTDASWRSSSGGSARPGMTIWTGSNPGTSRPCTVPWGRTSPGAIRCRRRSGWSRPTPSPTSTACPS
ncbi:MAG: NAD-dependent epimerase/dehydratase family protein [Bacillati bacterium ANGP1]|uniref:NAD-dependent epimerase/dehydratase family protein n=1 Tax=Candidatus Segetimicrobium genomatis TaxID=2569760 RepID=A0A537J7J6_9BACT|nr:MAG: NAD-dependent epimerase/dehydratase family protein [Terrabacteria group bacterium ANGP1]